MEAYDDQVATLKMARVYSPYSKVDDPNYDAGGREVYFHELAATVPWIVSRLEAAHQRINKLEERLEGEPT